MQFIEVRDFAQVRNASFEVQAGEVVVLVEGLDDAYLVSAVRRAVNATGVRVVFVQGTDSMQSTAVAALLAQAAAKGARGVGLFRDAEGSRDQRFSELSEFIKGVDPGAEPSDGGLFPVNVGGTSLGCSILVAPEGESTGAIESLLVPQCERKDPRVWGCVEGLLTCIKVSMNTVKGAKIALRAFLATYSPSNTGLGVAFRDETLDADSEELAQVKRFLNGLVGT
ncbi:MAG: hypothetical protein AKCLJLPJ_01780 [Fimbriimonadales bacterium]|nr:hypothetical protein [Fimbriimonadales bacterium]